jgi:hypothetical protein
MGIFDKLKYGNTFGNTISIRDTVVKQYPKKEEPKVEEPKVEEPKVEEPKVEEEIVEELKPKKKPSKSIVEDINNIIPENNEKQL